MTELTKDILQQTIAASLKEVDLTATNSDGEISFEPTPLVPCFQLNNSLPGTVDRCVTLNLYKGQVFQEIYKSPGTSFTNTD